MLLSPQKNVRAQTVGFVAQNNVVVATAYIFCFVVAARLYGTLPRGFWAFPVSGGAPFSDLIGAAIADLF